MNIISNKLERLLVSMGMSPHQWQISNDREGWELVFAVRHPEIWNRRGQHDHPSSDKRPPRER